MRFFLNIKTCIDRRARRTGSTNTHCELSLKLFFKTIIREDDWSSIYTERTLSHQLHNTHWPTVGLNGLGLFRNALWSVSRYYIKIFTWFSHGTVFLFCNSFFFFFLSEEPVLSFTLLCWLVKSYEDNTSLIWLETGLFIKNCHLFRDRGDRPRSYKANCSLYTVYKIKHICPELNKAPVLSNWCSNISPI